VNKATIDKGFMRIALEAAKKAFEKGEVPVGAVIVDQGEIIAEGCNSCEEHMSQLYHAEMVALAQLESKNFLDPVLYCTHEPCPMCMGAIVEKGIKKIVYGASEPRWGCLGGVVDLSRILKVEVTPHVLEEECREIIQKFFKLRRQR
jgi:tRNA(adenine34) deaminase